jgi:hypothetical protein
MRQRRDVEQLRRVYEGQVKEREERVSMMERELREVSAN